MKTFAFVFARGGSKGVPGKNIRPLAGKPLLGYSLDIARQLSEITRIFVSTDSMEIAAVAEQFGAIAIPRPSRLAQDDSPEWLAWCHAIEWVYENVGAFDCFVSLPATAPLRIPQDIRQCLALLDSKTDAVVTMTPAQRSPWFNMVKANEEGELSLLVEGDQVVRRQDAPDGYDMTTIAYVLRPDFIMKNDSIWDGRVRGVIIPQARAIDIDTAFDFKIAEFLMQERLSARSTPC